MARYHINEEGKMGVCKAEEGNCPMGTVYHFDNADEANHWSGVYSEFMVAKKNLSSENVYDKEYRKLFNKTHEKRELQTFEYNVEKEKETWGDDNIIYINPKEKHLDDYRRNSIKTLMKVTEEFNQTSLSKDAFHYIIESPDKIIGFTSNNQLLDGIVYNKVTEKVESWEVKSLDNYGAQISQIELGFNPDGSIEINQEEVLGKELNDKINNAMADYRSSDESTNFSRSNPKLDLSEEDIAEYFIKHHAAKGMRTLHLYDSNKGLNQHTEIELNYIDEPSEENLKKDIENITKTAKIQLNVRQNYSETIDFNKERDLNRYKDNYKTSFRTFVKDREYIELENKYNEAKEHYEKVKRGQKGIIENAFSDSFRQKHGSRWAEAKNEEINWIAGVVEEADNEQKRLAALLSDKKESSRYAPTEFTLSDLDTRKDWIKVEERPRSKSKPRRTVLQIGEFYKEFNNTSLKELREMTVNINDLGIQKPKLTGVIKSRYEDGDSQYDYIYS